MQYVIKHHYFICFNVKYINIQLNWIFLIQVPVWEGIKKRLNYRSETTLINKLMTCHINFWVL